jgi:DNA-binding LacI/PurR family transcriptional regulator
MTQKEIAREANVSVSTVSRVINNKGKNVASQEVRDRIWEIVRRTNYVPNDSAQKLRSGQISPTGEAMGSIECLFARMPFSGKDQFFSELARNVEVEALGLNYVLKYSFTSLALQTGNVTKTLAESTANGVVILGRCDKVTLSLIQKRFKNICYVGLNYFKPEYDQVICDGMEASKAAVNYLVNLGHTKIGYIGEAMEEIRYIGYRNAMIEKKLPTESRYVANVLLSYEGGYNGAKKLLASARDITAVFCANDITAVGAMRAFQESGLSIPKDISVIGVDDIETSKYLAPPLTTIGIPIEEMGKIAAKILVDRIRGGHRIPSKVLLPFHLEARESCAKPRMDKRLL